MKYDVLVIGAGLSGLAAGIRLAHFNKKVCVIEKHTVVGGLNSFYTRKQRTIDVGLHAMTNYSPKGVRSSPLGKLLKQLRFRHEEFRLCEQVMSEIRFPEKALRFTNDFEFLRQEIAEQFPSEIDGFQKLLQKIEDYDELALEGNTDLSARVVVESCIHDTVLVDMLFCPLMYYGSAREQDMDFYQFVIMFKSIFFEGFAKPIGGMHYILNLLLERYQKLGGELRMGDGVQTIHVENGTARAVTLESGKTLEAKKIISSMGSVETLSVCNPQPDLDTKEFAPGQVSFMESLFVLDREPKDLGYDKTIIFFCTKPRFNYQVPKGLIDVTSGVLCCPNNFQYPEPLKEGMIRLTNLANFSQWDNLPRRDYIQAKKEERARALQSIFTFFPDFSDSVVFLDAFTPKTIKKYTGHLNGAVYGAPSKLKNGTTPVENLYICGTDQGFLGIIGATLSGISIANLYGLSNPD
jgi:phytoene dehydrogenase-like protein